MKSRSLAVAVCVSILGLASSSSADPRAAGSLARANVFAIGGVGVTGVMSNGEKDLRSVLSAPDAVQRLQSLLTKTSPAGQLYALLGLRLRDRPAYEQAVPPFRKRADAVTAMAGCNIMQERMDQIVRQIDQGHYDAALKREPW